MVFKEKRWMAFRKDYTQRGSDFLKKLSSKEQVGIEIEIENGIRLGET
jgi:hypothetical protein